MYLTIKKEGNANKSSLTKGNWHYVQVMVVDEYSVNFASDIIYNKIVPENQLLISAAVLILYMMVVEVLHV